MIRTIWLLFAALWLVGYGSISAQAHWNGPSVDDKTKEWFGGLASNRGLCCSFADGVAIGDVDWDTTGDPKFPYRVRLEGKWIKVPEAAVVLEPNKFGRAVVWPFQNVDGKTDIRCFMPGAGA